MDTLRAIQEAVDYIEAHLPESPRVEEIARAAGLSSAHFQRVFRAVVGETVGSYARRRRLSRSVDALLSGDDRILDIALQAGFESQEAYTRAFKHQFGVPPGRFRERGQRAPGLALPRITRERLEIARDLGTAPPRIVTHEASDYVGLRATVISVLSDGSDNREVISALWQRFYEGCRSRGLEATDAYGLCFPREAEQRKRVDELVYMASYRTNGAHEVPPDMECKHVPGARYAVFEHRAPALALPDMILHVLIDWLPGSAYEYSGGVEVDFHPGDSERPLEYWLPVR
jgi:AraC family transcriptional regulator